MVMVTGALIVCTSIMLGFDMTAADISRFQVDEEQRHMNYSQVFQLLPDGAGSYFVFNDVFRLIY